MNEAMRGQILDYSIQANSGAISGEDGQRYSFSGAEWEGSGSPVAGMAVDFVPIGVTATQIYAAPTQGSPTNVALPPGEASRPGYGIRCMQCNSNVVPEGAINWLLFIVFLLLCLPVGLIYLVVQMGKPRRCPVCGGSSFQNQAA